MRPKMTAKKDFLIIMRKVGWLLKSTLIEFLKFYLHFLIKTGSSSILLSVTKVPSETQEC